MGAPGAAGSGGQVQTNCPFRKRPAAGHRASPPLAALCAARGPPRTPTSAPIGERAHPVRINMLMTAYTSASSSLSRTPTPPVDAGALSQVNGSPSCPDGTRAPRSAWGSHARPCFATSRAMAPGSVATSTHRIGPPQRLQVSTSARNTCFNSQPHLDLPCLDAGADALPPEPKLSSS